jgi:proton glutamate symport protein
MVGSGVLAIIVGIFFPSIGNSLKECGNIFLTFISISIIPIVFSSVTCSVIRLITEKLHGITVSKIILIFMTSLIFAGSVGVIVEKIMNPGASMIDSEVITNMIFQDVQKLTPVLSIYEPLNSIQKFSFSNFLETLLPRNPFAAFAAGNVIQILSISILIGISVAHFPEAKKAMVLRSLNILMEVFRHILKIPTKVLPIGMFFLIASNLSKIKIYDLFAMKSFCLSVLTVFALIIAASILILAVYSPINLKESILSLKKSIIIAFSTCSNQAVLPFLTQALKNDFKLSEDGVDLAIPIGITMCRTSNVAYYAFVSLFIASIYNEPISTYQYFFIIFGSIITSFSASGASGIVAITMISIILDPLNLPIDSILIILIAVDPIIEPFRTITSLLMNAAISCFIVNTRKERANAHK